MNIYDQRQIFRRNPLFSIPTIPSASQEKIPLCSPINSEDWEPWEQLVIPDFWSLTERFVWSETRGDYVQNVLLTRERSKHRWGPSTEHQSRSTVEMLGSPAGLQQAETSRFWRSLLAVRHPSEISLREPQECIGSAAFTLPSSSTGSLEHKTAKASLLGWHWGPARHPHLTVLAWWAVLQNSKNSVPFAHSSPDWLYSQMSAQHVII